MSKPIEPKFPKRRFSAHYGREMVAPDGCYLLPVGSEITAEDWSWMLGDPGWVRCTVAVVSASDKYAWTYARRLPEGQANDDLPEQDAVLPAVDPRTQALAAEQRRVAQLRDALLAVYGNCRQNRNKGIGAGPLARVRKALIAAGVDLKAPLQWEGTPEAEEAQRPHDWVARMVPLIEKFTPYVIELVQPKSQAAYEKVIEVAAAMARKALHEAVRFREPAAPPEPGDTEPTTAVDDEHLDPAAALKLYRSTVRENGHAHPDAPVLRMTCDGKVTAFGAVEAPAGCFLLPAGETAGLGDLYLTFEGVWLTVNVSERVQAPCQFTYARKLPPVERFDGSFP